MALLHRTRRTLTGTFRAVSDEEYARLCAGTHVPHRASVEWDDYAVLLPERELWQGARTAWCVDGRPRALLTLRRFHIHRMPVLWAEGSPLWPGGDPTPEEERALVEDLRRWVSSVDPAQALVRLAVLHHEEVPGVVPTCQQLYAHDSTVVIDLDGDEEALRSRMKGRGRRGVNRSLRRTRVVVEEETGVDRTAFEEVYGVLHATAQRQGFHEHDVDYYWRFLTHFRDRGMARLWVGRVDGRAVNWGLAIIRGDFATWEVAASDDEGRRQHGPDVTLYRALLDLQASGVRTCDLAAIGSDDNPALMGLNEFKTKWATGVTRVGAPMELVLQPARHRLLNALAARVSGEGGMPAVLRAAERERAAREAEERAEPVLVDPALAVDLRDGRRRGRGVA